MWKLIGVIGFLGFSVSLIMFLIKAITKKGIKKRFSGLGIVLFFILFLASIINYSPDEPEPGVMTILTCFGIVVIGASIYIYKLQKKQTNTLKKLYPGCKVVVATNYYVIENDGIILANKMSINNKSSHIKISKLNDAKIYEDGKETSLGKAVVGGIAFGVVGALVGSNIKTQRVKKMGIKLFTDSGVYDIKTLNTQCKKDDILYKNASRVIDEVYNMIVKLDK